MFTLHNGDCLQILPSIPSGSIDAIITDLPYGTTACEWDSIIPLAPMWEQVKRVLKPNGVFVTTASQPFTTILINSNLEYFRYEWIWEKHKGTNSLLVKKMPLKIHESILVFGNSGSNYFPQMEDGVPYKIRSSKNIKKSGAYHEGEKAVGYSENYDPSKRYPVSIQKFINHNEGKTRYHPTQKPVDLYRYLIRTYTNEGETVLDICMGSGTTIEAAEIEGRNSIGIEKDTEFGYFQTAEKRAKSAVLQQRLFTPSNNRLHLDVGDSPAQQALFTSEADTAEGKLPAKSPRR